MDRKQSGNTSRSNRETDDHERNPKTGAGFVIYTPAGYKTDGAPNPLLVLFDGDDILSDDFQGQTTLDNLIVVRKINTTVMVMVDALIL